MRYALGGGLSDERRRFREGIRMNAAEGFARGEPSSAIAKELRVSVRSVQRWRRAWDKGGPRAMRVAHGWPDQRWTLSRIKTVTGRRFHKSYTLQGVRKLLIRHGFSCQIPTRRAVERNEDQVTGWAKETWPQVEAPRRRSTPGSSLRTRPASR